MKTLRKHWITALGISLGLVLSAQIATAAENDPLRSRTAEWWQWALSIPTAQNPMLDTTGERCALGQRGSTWFLTGAFGGGPVERTCSIPAGKELFFPVVNGMFFDSPNVCGQGSEHLTVQEMRSMLAAFTAGVTDLSVEVDGRPVRQVRRVQSRIFEVVMPEDNAFDAVCASVGGQPAGIFAPAVDDGYYVSLKPLPPGEHTLHFHAENAEFGFVIDTLYHLNIVPVALGSPKIDG